MAKKEYTIDAINRTVGRVASEAAFKLMGKNTPEYEANIAPKVTVKIINASKAKIPVAKLKAKVYLRHSQYPGGQKSETMEQVIAKFGYGEVFKRAVYGMLPKNKLRSIMINNLSLSE
ncbi:MAG: 50S ribosomal protein L13 [Parcubacteria group bacterium GW2011_GWF2_38_76]|nr:MAG: 50S ribosomal protein L13 [Parcubacteria group bacterium GW2011_GWF2_38_76]